MEPALSSVPPIIKKLKKQKTGATIHKYFLLINLVLDVALENPIPARY